MPRVSRSRSLRRSRTFQRQARPIRGAHGLAALTVIALLGGCGSTGSTETARSTATRSTSSAALTAQQNYRQIVAASVAACKRGVHSSDEVSNHVKGELEEACNEGYKGLEPREVHVTSKSVCEELALLIPSNSASTKAKAFADCYAIATEQ